MAKKGRNPRKHRTLFATILLCAISSLTTNATPPPGYYLVWSDEFNSSTLDRSKWDYWLPGHRRNAVNVANAVSLNGSNLVITTYTSNDTHYTGMIATHETFRSRYGYWESSIQWADTNGMWSAFWMQSPEMVNRRSDPQISGSEIDIAEHRFVDKTATNIANQIQVNLHWNGYGPSSSSSSSGNVGANLAGDFHTYGFLWTPDSYSFLVDDSQVYRGRSSPISHSTEWVILSSEVDDTSTLWAGHIPAGGYGNLPDSTTKFTVDYVRYYAPTNQIFWTGTGSSYWTNSANWISDLTPLTTSDLTFCYLSSNLNSILARDFTVNGLVFLHMKDPLSIAGTNLLTIGAGGLDMSAANRPATITAPVRVAAGQTWFVGPKTNALNLNGELSGSAALTKSGPGKLVLNGTNLFSGALNVAAGSLFVNGSLAADALSISGTLGGNGTIGGPATVQAGGVISPGDSIGKLTFTGKLELAPDGATVIEINKASRTNDQLSVSGLLTYQGRLIVLNVAGDLAAGDGFKLFDAGSYAGSFDRMILPPLATGLEWNTNRLTNGILSVVASH